MRLFTTLFTLLLLLSSKLSIFVISTRVGWLVLPPSACVRPAAPTDRRSHTLSMPSVALRVLAWSVAAAASSAEICEDADSCGRTEGICGRASDAARPRHGLSRI